MKEMDPEQWFPEDDEPDVSALIECRPCTDAARSDRAVLHFPPACPEQPR
jgi:hypothetical protein